MASRSPQKNGNSKRILPIIVVDEPNSDSSNNELDSVMYTGISIGSYLHNLCISLDLVYNFSLCVLLFSTFYNLKNLQCQKTIYPIGMALTIFYGVAFGRRLLLTILSFIFRKRCKTKRSMILTKSENQCQTKPKQKWSN